MAASGQLRVPHLPARGVNCPAHGVHQVRLPWAEPHSRFTVLFEWLAIDVCKERDVLGAARLLQSSWDEAWHLMDRAVVRGLAAKRLQAPARVGWTRSRRAAARSTSR